MRIGTDSLHQLTAHRRFSLRQSTKKKPLGRRIREFCNIFPVSMYIYIYLHCTSTVWVLMKSRSFETLLDEYPTCSQTKQAMQIKTQNQELQYMIGVGWTCFSCCFHAIDSTCLVWKAFELHKQKAPTAALSWSFSDVRMPGAGSYVSESDVDDAFPRYSDLDIMINKQRIEEKT